MFLKTAAGAIVLALLSVAVHAHAQQAYPSSSREQLNQLVAELQKNPSDDTLREKIIKLALAMKPKPSAPAEVYELAGRAKYAAEHAGSSADYAAAAEAFGKASDLSPWAAELYLNQGATWEKAQKLDLAVKSFQWYVIAAPDAQDVNTVRERIGGLKYQIEKAAAAQQQRAAADEAARRAQQLAQEQAREQARQAELRAQEQARAAQERRQKYPFEGTWESVLDRETVGVLGKGYGGGRTIRIWYTGSDWRAEFVHMTGTPLTVQGVTGNHITLLWDARDDQVFQNIWPIELDISSDLQRLDGKVLSTPVSGGAWERGNHKTIWLPAAFVRAGY